MTGSIASSAFNYDLPEAQIAQRPISPADAAKMLIVDSHGGAIRASTFKSFQEYVQPEDLLVFNNSKVIPARLRGKNAKTGGGFQVFLLKEISGGVWRCTGKPLKKMTPGTRIEFSDSLRAEVLGRCDDEVEIRFGESLENPAVVRERIRAAGSMPIPPYIRGGEGDEQDRLDYQPVLAEHDGSVAAPTASLHFTPELLENLRSYCQICTVTLHVGQPSFTPLWREGQGEELTPPGKEWLIYDREITSTIQATRDRGGRVIGIGTTAVRALESMAQFYGQEEPGDGQEVSTELFISPGYEFQWIDAMVTNFHMPRSSHLLLVQAFLGRERLEESYRFALDNDFRFLSYGDGMLLTNSCQQQEKASEGNT
jgi:S-adenosylmethionine:tRNA ribosyltransferase-isomerase